MESKIARGGVRKEVIMMVIFDDVIT